MEKEIEFINVDLSNIASEHICCAIGEDKENQARARIKKEWLKRCIPDGHVFKKANVRGKVFIEFCPAEKAWFPVIADGYFFIQCFWVSGKYQGTGMGSALLAECEKDCHNSHGLLAITSAKKLPFLPDKKFFIRKGFTVADTADNGFELLVKPFRENGVIPRFTDRARRCRTEDHCGITLYYSDMCPFVPAYTLEMKAEAEERGFVCSLEKIDTREKARNAPTPFTIFSVFADGRFLTHELMTRQKFGKLLDTIR